MSTKKSKKSKKITIKNENKVTVNIHHPTRKRSKKKSSTPKNTVTLGNPLQRQIQNFFNNEIPPRRESQNQLLEMAYTYNAPELRKNLMIKDQPDQKEQWEDIVQPPSSTMIIKPKREYNKKVKTVTQQLGFPDTDSATYLNSLGVKALKTTIKKEHPNIPDSVLKTINGKNKKEKISQYLQNKDQISQIPIEEEVKKIKIRKSKNKHTD
jgi:hypothetical protein